MRRSFEGWTIVQAAAVVVAVLVAATVAVGGVGSDGLRLAIRNTARCSLVLLFGAFIASSAVELWRTPWAKWLLRNRKYLGLSFAVSHFSHLALIAGFGAAYPETFANTVGYFGIFGGGAGYLFLIAMTVTSFDGPRRRLSKRSWKILHKTGMWIFWGIFASSYLGRAVNRPVFLPLALLVVTGIALRVAARVKRWGRRRARAAQVA